MSDPAVVAANGDIVAGVRDQIRELSPGTSALGYRPDVQAVLADLETLKNLQGGPADATAFHDFNVLQVAFESVWVHAFDDKLRHAVESLYEATANHLADLGLAMPDVGTLDDRARLEQLLRDVRDLTTTTAAPIPDNVSAWFSATVSTAQWAALGDSQRAFISDRADFIQSLIDQGRPIFTVEVNNLYKVVAEIVAHPEGATGRIARLLDEVTQALAEPYAFDVYAADSYNFGLLLTYRQRWKPGPYQAGDLRATIPLAPGESRKYSKKTHTRTTRSAKESEKSLDSRSRQVSDSRRAEQDIMSRSTTNTNFKTAASGSFDIGVGSINASTDFALNQAAESAATKRDFHEATLKAAEEYRLERSLEVDTSHTLDVEDATSGEISNPNNEITVTYLFYELQRRYQVTELIYRARPVILVAQAVPAPHQIDEAWLIEHQWILGRVLLDESFRSALVYLTSGFAGDEVSLELQAATWAHQRDAARALEAQVKAHLTMRDVLRESLVQSALQRSQADLALKQDEVGAAGSILSPGNAMLAGLTGGLSMAFQADQSMGTVADDQAKIEALEAARKAAETRLGYTEQALSEAQDKLDRATDAFQKATAQYSDALQKKFNRDVAIDQLRIHVKQNVLHYMQAIWDSEPTDQRYFRLHNVEVLAPGHSLDLVDVTLPPPPPPTPADRVLLKEIADLDNPIGYKGNYVIFPLKKALYLTTFMLKEFVDEHTGIRDPDDYANFDFETFDYHWDQAVRNGSVMVNGTPQTPGDLRAALEKYLSVARRTTDEIIVPTGQLFIEALTGAHPLLEDFKLLHRVEDVRKVKAEVRHAELENLRLASRLVAAQADPPDHALLDDPDIEKKVVVEGAPAVRVDADT